ncbi:MAG: site-2 protease family protein [Candidatus Saccharibacteria bacterium]|nr:site-2 protease family protein [Candidatus Saccharibacteria bacterium]
MNISTLVIYFVIVLVSISVHEAAHALVSYLLGDDTAKLQGRVSFNPLKHLDLFMSLILPMMLVLAGLPAFGGAKPVQINQRKIKWGEYGMALVALAGPVSNFIQAFIAFGIMTIAINIGNTTVALIGYIGVQVNLGFMLFNLLPLPPLDGSRVLYALVPDYLQNLMNKIEQYGMMILIIFVIIANQFLSFYILNVSNAIQTFFKVIFNLFN